MKKFSLFFVVAVLGMVSANSLYAEPADGNLVTNTEVSKSIFKCDGRTRCTQMTSCEEAKFFIIHCPNTKMDGDKDGVPCEDQWCGHDRRGW